MDDFGQRSTGILVSDRLSLPITVIEPSVVRWRWKLGEGEQMHFTVMFKPMAVTGEGGPAEPEELLLAEQLLSTHSSDSLRLTRPGVLNLTWSMLAESNWLKVFLLPATPAKLEYHCRVLPAEELQRRARGVRLGTLSEFVGREKQAAAAIRATVEGYKASLQELRAQMLLIETHVREQEEAADLAEAKVVEYDAERTKLLHEAEADARGERALPGPRGDMAPITEEDAGC